MEVDKKDYTLFAVWEIFEDNPLKPHKDGFSRMIEDFCSRQRYSGSLGIMKFINATICLLLIVVNVFSQPVGYKNVWDNAPSHIPNSASTDAPLMGNGDIGMCVGFEKGVLRYYLTKNDFWRLQSKADHLSGPRVGGYIDLKVKGLENADFSAEQSLVNGVTECIIKDNQSRLSSYSWVSATENIIVITLSAVGESSVEIDLSLDVPHNNDAIVEKGFDGECAYMTRSFTKNVDIPTKIAVAINANGFSDNSITLYPGKSVTLFIAVESMFKYKKPLKHVLREAKNMTVAKSEALWEKHNNWWQSYWNKSSFVLDDKVLMKAYYQGLYTMAACSRDKVFPPALFGWVTTDNPQWNGDYHLNYNFYAPFYGLYGANRIEQTVPQDAPLLDFIDRGCWYAKHVTNTRGILYPVGIGPLGVEVTRDFPIMQDNGYTMKHDVECGGLFYKQRSNALFGTVNMVQHWRHTYDLEYAKKIYPYLLGVADFWEDYLVQEDGFYQVYNDAGNEKSGFNKNTGMTLALLRNSLDATIDISRCLGIDAHRRTKWINIRDNLKPLPIWDNNGAYLLRGSEEDEAGNPVYDVSFSMIYPANGVTLDSDSLLLASGKNSVAAIQQWQHHNSTNSFYVAAIRVGYDADVIWSKLHSYAESTYPNGFQLDNPHGIENSCTVMNALHEMACMSVNGKIRLFSVWPKDVDASFKNIRTCGAFLLSASMNQGTVNGVTVFSEKGRCCTVVNPWIDKNVLLIRDGKRAETLCGKELVFLTSENETIQLKPLK